MYSRGPPVSQLLLHGAPSEGEPTFVEPGALLGAVSHPDHHWGSVGHSPEAGLAFGQCPLVPFPLADIAGHHVDPWHALPNDRTRRGLHIHSGAIEALPVVVEQRRRLALIQHDPDPVPNRIMIL